MNEAKTEISRQQVEVARSEQLTFKCEWCEDTGVMITGMDCICDSAPNKS
jgi:hypothetical protein